MTTPNSNHEAPTTTDLEEAWEGYETVEWPASRLRPHPESVRIFGPPAENPAYEEVRDSIQGSTLQEPLIVLSDGRILSGSTRHHAVVELFGPKVKIPVRIHPGFASLQEEVEYLIDANTKRRQLTKRQIAAAYKLLKELPQSKGG